MVQVCHGGAFAGGDGCFMVNCMRIEVASLNSSSVWYRSAMVGPGIVMDVSW